MAPKTSEWLATPDSGRARTLRRAAGAAPGMARHLDHSIAVDLESIGRQDVQVIPRVIDRPIVITVQVDVAPASKGYLDLAVLEGTGFARAAYDL